MSQGGKLGALLELSRVSNLPTVWTNVLAASLIAGGVDPSVGLGWFLIPLLIGASLVYCGGMILNDVLDLKWDERHRTERPIPSGRFARKTAMIIAWCFLLGGALVMALGGAVWWWLLLLLVAIVLYDYRHKQWLESIWIMGTCRTLLFIAAGSAAGGLWPGFMVLLAGLALGFYTVGITLAARNEVKVAPVPHLGLLLLVMPAVGGVATWFLRSLPHWGGWIVFVVLIGWLAYSLSVLKALRIGPAVGLLLAGIVVVDASAVAFLHPWIGLLMLVFLPVTLLFQKRIAAT